MGYLLWAWGLIRWNRSGGYVTLERVPTPLTALALKIPKTLQRSPTKVHPCLLDQGIAACHPLQSRLQHLLTAKPAIIYSCQPYPPYGATFISDNICRQLGYTPQNFLDDPGFWLQHLHPEDRERVLAELHTLS